MIDHSLSILFPLPYIDLGFPSLTPPIYLCPSLLHTLHVFNYTHLLSYVWYQFPTHISFLIYKVVQQSTGHECPRLFKFNMSKSWTWILTCILYYNPFFLNLIPWIIICPVAKPWAWAWSKLYLTSSFFLIQLVSPPNWHVMILTLSVPTTCIWATSISDLNYWILLWAGVSLFQSSLASNTLATLELESSI